MAKPLDLKITEAIERGKAAHADRATLLSSMEAQKLREAEAYKSEKINEAMNWADKFLPDLIERATANGNNRLGLDLGMAGWFQAYACKTLAPKLRVVYIFPSGDAELDFPDSLEWNNCNAFRFRVYW